MSDCRFGVSPVNCPDPDPDGEHVEYNILSGVQHRTIGDSYRRIY